MLNIEKIKWFGCQPMQEGDENMGCKFCKIIKRAKKLNNKEIGLDMIPIYDTKICESESFLVVPVLGSIIEGYILIISKQHINSMAELKQQELRELNSLINLLGELAKKAYGVIPTLFEHGTPPAEAKMASQSSIYHAHMHLIPYEFKSSNEIIEESGMQLFNGIEDLHRFIGGGYVYYRKHWGQEYITVNEILPSQYMRRKLADEVGKFNEWNWRAYPFIENVEKTISTYQQFLEL